ncbi:MAG: hypothetical protein DWQ21_08620 [Bacteroidetes bacterium]|nr:MAG: hypothetical protein DWQ21_08620 [Bacteroidota bacterium]REK51261.1 MAG: hypothetical protein DWQ49_14740 [Bacteroidota bacterium]
MKKIIVLLFVVLGFNASAQQVLPWEMLAVPYSTTPDGLYEPQFPSWLDKYKNTEVVIQGYLVPVDVEGNQYALSRYAFSSCFFCGNAAPNTVVELVFKDRPDDLITDQFVVVKGILVFNADDPFRLFFILQQTEFAG